MVNFQRVFVDAVIAVNCSETDVLNAGVDRGDRLLELPQAPPALGELVGVLGELRPILAGFKSLQGCEKKIETARQGKQEQMNGSQTH